MLDWGRTGVSHTMRAVWTDGWKEHTFDSGLLGSLTPRLRLGIKMCGFPLPAKRITDCERFDWNDSGALGSERIKELPVGPGNPKVY